MDIQNSCGALIKQIHDELEKKGNNAMRPQGLTISQLDVLLALNRAEEHQLPSKRLEQILHVAQSTTAGIVARLEQKGFVVCFQDAEDRRIKMVRISEAGIQCCREAERSMEAAENEILSTLTDTERVIFHALLQKVHDSLC